MHKASSRVLKGPQEVEPQGAPKTSFPMIMQKFEFELQALSEIPHFFCRAQTVLGEHTAI